jgi:hypothetical protein
MSVIKTQVNTPVVIAILAWHKSLAACVAHQVKTVETVAAKCKTLIVETYGDVPPTFKQYKDDMAAFHEIAEKGKVSEQNLLRAYRDAVKELFGELLKSEGSPSGLPVSQEPKAVEKRMERKAKDEKIAEALKLAEKTAQSTPVGAPVGQTQERQPSEAEQTESIVARIGVYECMYACLRIMAASKVTEAQALHMRKMADKMRQLQDEADAAARLAAITVTAPVTELITA